MKTIREQIREDQNNSSSKFTISYNHQRNDLYKLKKGQSHKNKLNRNLEVNKILQTINDDGQKQMIKDDTKIRNLLERDLTLFCIVHEDLKNDDFKLYVNDLIAQYRKDNITYLIKIYSHIPYECTVGIDSFTEDSNITVLNGLYTRGNVHRIEESTPITKDQVDNFFKYKRGLNGIFSEEDLKRVSLLIKNDEFTIFEILSP